ncbi:hypothetical protein ACHAPN_004323 [Verticillium nonalfalfae]
MTKDLDALPMEAKRYADHVSVLNALVARRAQVHERIEQLCRLEKAIRPYRISDNGLGLQENVVTRGGEVERELEQKELIPSLELRRTKSNNYCASFDILIQVIRGNISKDCE